MNHLKILDTLDFRDKKVLLRVDFNVPLASGKITDDTRIRESLPSIQYILAHGGAVILISHLGRPKGKPDPALSLKPCAAHLAQLLKKPVLFAPDCIGAQTQELAKSLQSGSILLLENLRFYAAEEKPDTDPTFAKQLASLGDLYVDDAFAAAHRAHSSTYTIVPYFKGKAAIGLLMQKEIEAFEHLLSSPERPFYTLIGGAKISTKIGLLKALALKVDSLFIGGAMAFTFLKAMNVSIGDSLYEEAYLSEARDILDAYTSQNKSYFLPVDCVIADSFSETAQKKTISLQEGIPAGWRGMDIGPKTVQEWQLQLQKAKTVFWNGPLGVFEFPSFSQGTRALAQTLANLHAMTIVGGGDSVAAINQLHLKEKFTHVSTGGGATLEYIEQGHLPGIDILYTNS